MKSLILKNFPSQIDNILKVKMRYSQYLTYLMILFNNSIKRQTIVTILGCCRQDSISRKFNESQIRNDLSYTHSTKEVLQVIDFLNDKNYSEFSPYSFRTPQINGRIPNRNRLMKQWRITNVVVIEISSLKFYLREKVVYHHEAFDNPESLATSCKEHLKEQNKSISEHIQSIPELIDDLSLIVQKLAGKKIIFTTNFVTRKNGTRFLIYSALKEFCQQHNHEFIDTHQIFNYWRSQDILIEEPVLAHLNHLGHEIMLDRYDKAITQVSMEDQKIRVLTAKYVSYPRTENIYGLGDYLFGLMHLYQLTNLSSDKILLKVDYSQSSLVFDRKQSTVNSSEEPEYYFHEADDADILSGDVVFTNKRPKSPVSVSCRDFIFRNALPFDENFMRKAAEIFKKYNLIPGQYTVIHVRLGDTEVFLDASVEQIALSQVVETIFRVIQNFDNERNYLLVVDSKNLKMKLQGFGIPVTVGSVAHTGNSLNELTAIEDTLLEFYLLLKSEKIIQLSTHSWGSGFSECASILGGVALDRINLNL